jgi:arylsulfatase A-like enzyme
VNDQNSHDDTGKKNRTPNRRDILLGSTTLAAASAIGASAPLTVAQAQAQRAAPSGGKPNILIIWGDDIGIANISAYSNGLMGYETPNIDRIAREGLKLQHYYGEQSCTAGRSAFLTGQHIIRSGLSKVGFPGAPMGMSQLDPSIGGLLKNLGYVTGQFGKNHVGDRNPSLPTVNGFDEFFGNLYHLNAEEEPELPDYPKDPAYRAKFGPRGVLKCKGTEVDDATVDPLRQGRQVDHRGHRPAHKEAHGDDRRRNLGRGHRLHEAATGGGQTVLYLVQRNPHAPADACPRRASRPVPARRQRVHRRHAGA